MPPNRYQSLNPPRRRRSFGPVILVVLLVVIVGGVIWLSVRDSSVPTGRIEQDVTNMIGTNAAAPAAPGTPAPTGNNAGTR